MNVFLASAKWQYAIIFIDDATIIFKLPKEHVRYTEDVFG